MRICDVAVPVCNHAGFERVVGRVRSHDKVGWNTQKVAWVVPIFSTSGQALFGILDLEQRW